MSLWQASSADETSKFSNNELDNTFIPAIDDIGCHSSISARETEKALRHETNSPFIRFPATTNEQSKQAKLDLSRFSIHSKNRNSIPQLPTRRYFPPLPTTDKANQRCGQWYIPPSHLHSSAYFKSTDGHYGNWSFSARRLNLEFLQTIVKYGGYTYTNIFEVDRSAVLVDSTRRGKRMSDALSKTVPIWCAVINRCISAGNEWTETYFPKECVSVQEMFFIESLIPSFVQLFKVVLSISH
jgi:hypothetical protein